MGIILTNKLKSEVKYIKSTQLSTFNQFSSPSVLPKVIKENTKNNLIFNILPNKQVKETLHISEYTIKHREIIGTFDREYVTNMRHSPNHLIFLTALVHLQKLIYVYLCHEFGLKYNPYGDEVLKIWPTNLEIEMPKMITKTKNVSQIVNITNLKKTGKNSYFGNCTSTIEGIVTINADAAVFLV